MVRIDLLGWYVLLIPSSANGLDLTKESLWSVWVVHLSPGVIMKFLHEFAM